MSTLSWDDVGTRFYENGVSKGVLYGEDRKGVAWNGLTSVEEKNTDSADPLYFDGFKFGDLITLGDFEGTLKAFTYPDEFLPFQGILEADSGVYMTSQLKTRFGLCWRTEVNSDLGQNIGYKLHILYNLLAIPGDKEYQTLSLDNEPLEFQWDISGLPEEVDNFRPTAYIVIDSRKIDPFLLSDLEDLLYGTETTDPTLPNLNSLIIFVNNWGRLIIIDNGDGTWSATSSVPGVIDMLDPETFEIDTDTAVYLDPYTYEISSSDQEVIP